MLTIEVVPYRSNAEDGWNALNRAAANGHFLFDRGFMEYHADRFADASLVVLLDGAVGGIFPASRKDAVVTSHAGLTFGGLVTKPLPTPTVQAMLDACAASLKRGGASTLVYKLLPPIYHVSPASADAYWLFRSNARLTRRDLTTTIDHRAAGAMSSRRRRGIKRAVKEHLVFGSSERWSDYWEVLSSVLMARHGVAPVHSLGEITRLAKRFPDCIRLYTAERNGVVLAGVVMFLTRTVAHAQYIATIPDGRDVGALDGLFDHLIQASSAQWRYFDFGISTEAGGLRLNEGLIAQKEEFGGGPVCHDVYEVAL